VSEASKEGHSKSRGQPLRRHISAWWRCKQKEHVEDLVQSNGGSRREQEIRALIVGPQSSTK